MDDPDTADQLARISAAMDAELRAERSADEALAYTAELRGRSFAEALADLAARELVVTIRAGSEQLSGPLAAVGADWVAIRGPRARRFVPTSAIRSVSHDTARAAGTAGTTTTETFAAVLTALEVDEATAEVVLVDGASHTGRVLAAAADHLVLDARPRRLLLPRAAIAVVVIADPPSPTAV